MPRFGYCRDEYEHRRDAEQDARWNTPDHEYYDRHSDDPCKEVYTETFDQERERYEQERREELRREEQAEERHYWEQERIRQHEETAMEEEFRYRQYEDELDQRYRLEQEQK